MNEILNELDFKALTALSASSAQTIESVSTRLQEAGMRFETALPFFNEVTHGGLYNGINVIAGLPGVGKTTLLVQLAVEESGRGQPVVYITKDMSEAEIFLKVAAYTLGVPIDEAERLVCNDAPASLREKLSPKNDMLTIVDTDSAKFEAIAEECGAKLTETTNLGRIVELFCALHDPKKPIFIWDSLQSMALSAQYTAKDGVDLAMLEFKRLQRKFNVPFMLVSNLNRGSYESEISLKSLKESGNIEYEASSVLALEPNFARHPDIKEFREESVREVRLTNLKDRAGGFGSVVLDFDVTHGAFSKGMSGMRVAPTAAPEEKKEKRGKAGSGKGFVGVPTFGGAAAAAFVAASKEKEPLRREDYPQPLPEYEPFPGWKLSSFKSYDARDFLKNEPKPKK